MAVSVSSCNPKKAGSDNTEQEVQEQSEHPTGGDQEHPADSVGTSSESEEHPAGGEHPSGDEHPSN